MTEYIPPKLYDADGDLSKQWYVYYSIRRPDGKYTRYKVFGQMNRLKTKKERREAARVLIDAHSSLLREGWRPGQQAPAVLTFRQAFEQAAGRVCEGLRPRSQENIRLVSRHVAAWLEAHDPDMLAQDFGKVQASALLSWLKTSRQLKNYTVNKYAGFCRWICNRARDMGLLEANPFAGWRSLTEEKKSQNVAFTEAEARRLVEHMAANCPDLLLFVRFIYYAGLRRVEVCRMQIHDIDLERKRIAVPSEKSKVKKSAYVAIPDSFADHLRGLGLDRHPGDWYLFHQRAGSYVPGPSPLTPNRVSERFRAVRDACQVPTDRNLYSWKHYACIRAYQSGVSIRDIMIQFRHSNMDQTCQYLIDMGCDLGDYAGKIPEL